ncbi:MAG: prolipoprotein diacylglyceryl transferase [Gammaproteobacteria bacterium]
MLKYPNIDPIAFHLGPVPVHWYGMMYLFGFLAGWLLLRWRAKHSQGLWTPQYVADLIFYGALGLIIGGRVGYIVFYDFSGFLHEPWMIFKIWEGGMSFHGGLLGAILALWLYGRHIGKGLFDMTDFVAPIVPIGLGAGRLGNFINGELWGRVTDMPWGMVFPRADLLPRHPSELYEFLLEGVLLFAVLWCYSSKKRPKMAVSALFLLGYGLVRFLVEFFRQPDIQLGFIAWHWVTMGQLLSIPMILVGALLLVFAYRRK